MQDRATYIYGNGFTERYITLSINSLWDWRASDDTHNTMRHTPLGEITGTHAVLALFKYNFICKLLKING